MFSLRSVEVHILLSVVDRPRHGYAILQEAEERTAGRPGFEIPTLYRALRRLREADLIRKVAPPDTTAAAQSIVSVYFPEKGKKTQMLPGSPAEAARALVQKLRDEARVIS